MTASHPNGTNGISTNGVDLSRCRYGSNGLATPERPGELARAVLGALDPLSK
jgi:hypothetical protein